MRQHVEHLLAALGALAFALFISYFNTGSLVRFHPAPSHAQLAPIPSDTALATSTLPGLGISTTTFGSLLGPAAASSSIATVTPPAPQPAQKPQAPAAPPARPPAASTTPESNDEALLAGIRPEIVNILCYSHVQGLRSISGSGVVIDSRGIILTVAHVAQMLLLEQYLGDDKVSCTVRTGSPAHAAYLAHPIYVSDAWLTDNPTTLISSQPVGTGEHDYALLAITASASGGALPGAFPAAALSSGSASVGDEVGIGSYGAQDLSSYQVRNSLYPTLATSTIEDRFTFGRNTVDVLSIGGNPAAQEGSSGGAVTDRLGGLLSIITTSDVTGDTASREMRAITLTYIERSFLVDTGKDFRSYFGDTSLSTLVGAYTPTAEKQAASLAEAIGLTK